MVYETPDAASIKDLPLPCLGNSAVEVPSLSLSRVFTLSFLELLVGNDSPVCHGRIFMINSVIK